MISPRAIPTLVVVCLGLSACATQDSAKSLEPLPLPTLLPGAFYIGEQVGCSPKNLDMVRYKRDHTLEVCAAGGWQPVSVQAPAKKTVMATKKSDTAEPFRAPDEIVMPGRLDIGPDPACSPDNANIVHYRADRSLEICGSSGWRPVVIKQRPVSKAGQSSPQKQGTDSK